MSEWVLIAGMAVLTFIPRYIPFALAGKVTLPQWLEEALSYVPIAVLTTIIVQSTLIRDGELLMTLQNHHLIAAIVAFFVALISRHMFLTIAFGLISFALMEWVNFAG